MSTRGRARPLTGRDNGRRSVASDFRPQPFEHEFRSGQTALLRPFSAYRLLSSGAITQEDLARFQAGRQGLVEVDPELVLRLLDYALVEIFAEPELVLEPEQANYDADPQIVWIGDLPQDVIDEAIEIAFAGSSEGATFRAESGRADGGEGGGDVGDDSESAPGPRAGNARGVDDRPRARRPARG